MGFYRGPKTITDGLVFCLDAANPKSYPGTGTTLFDLSGNGNNGSLINGPAYSSENKGIIEFDGVNDTCRVGNDSSISISDNLTLSFWFYFTALDPGKYSVNFIRKMSTTADANFIIYFDGAYTPGKVRMLANRNGVWGVVSPDSPTLTPNAWYNIVWTYDNGGLMYTNGVVNGPKVSSGTLATNTEQLRIGDELSGGISDVRMYNKALTAEEVQQNYNATKSRFNL